MRKKKPYLFQGGKKLAYSKDELLRAYVQGRKEGENMIREWREPYDDRTGSGNPDPGIKTKEPRSKK